jgi:hypothetical protein
MDEDQVRAAVITVGEGRGFVVEGWDRYVITAAHCLPHLPPPASFLGANERTYKALLGPLGQEPTI